MLFPGWMPMLLVRLVCTLPEAAAQEAPKDACNSPLDAPPGEVRDFSGREVLAGLRRPGEAWCFDGGSVSSQTALLTIGLGRERLVGGLATQGPPEAVRGRSYSHLVAFVAAHSMDAAEWTEFNDGNLFFTVDKNDTSDVVHFHPCDTVELALHIQINVTMLISGPATICLRLQLYGCDADILPSTSLQAATTDKGQIEVKWQSPAIDTTLDPDASTVGRLRPSGYVVVYGPVESTRSLSAATADTTLSLEDVRLGATYWIRLQCLLGDVVLPCGSTQIDAYPPCPGDWTGGNEYHCFLYIGGTTSFSSARATCSARKDDPRLGGLGNLVDDDERRFLRSAILPDGVTELWLVGEACDEIDDCCKVLRLHENGRLEDAACGDEALSSAVCLRDHKGEGAKLRVTSAAASSDGTGIRVRWRYEGTGWKTDELQVKLWTGDGEVQRTLTHTTLEEAFLVSDLGTGQMYSLLLRPAPNIRTEEFVYKAIIIDFGEESDRYGALLTPISVSSYVIWSGSLRIAWASAEALSASGRSRKGGPYRVSFRSLDPEAAATEVLPGGSREFTLTPTAMQTTYSFDLSCSFAGLFHPCAQVSVTTDPPTLVSRQPRKPFVVYELFLAVPRPWAEAESDCVRRSGHLTSLLDEEEGKALLGLLPGKTHPVWTGARLGRKGTGYWTDGHKITDLPMAKTSGVTASSESCCRALDERGKLRLTGANCEDQSPYICKYLFEEMMSPPAGLTVESREWNSLTAAWKEPVQKWLPTFYNVRACPSEKADDCAIVEGVGDRREVEIRNLKPFTMYDVTVEAVLRPLHITTAAQTSVMTRPKIPVRIFISSKGVAQLDAPILVATGRADATLRATVFRDGETVHSATGSVREVPLTGLVPEEHYHLVVEEEGGQWKHELDVEAVPTCAKEDLSVGENCIRVITEQQNFEASKGTCSQRDASDDFSMYPWSPLAMGEVKALVDMVDEPFNFWLDPSKMNEAEIETNSDCGTGATNLNCCSYDVNSALVSCSSCCAEKLGVVCAYQVPADLGEASDLLPSAVGNASLEVRWSAPAGLAWTLERYEVRWADAEGGDVIGTRIEGGTGPLPIRDLEFGTEYEVTVTPLGARNSRGRSSKTFVTTLDPRTPLSVAVQPNGVARVYSPRLIEKGRGAEGVEVVAEEAGPREVGPLSAKGTAGGVDLAGLTFGAEYRVRMASADENPKKKFSYETTFEAYPSCPGKRIQSGLLCVWAPGEAETWTEASKICRREEGELLDIRTQKMLEPTVRALLYSHVRERFWVDAADAGTSAALMDSNADQCPSGKESEVVCCSTEGTVDDLKCSCCNESRPFACKSLAKVDFGPIGDIVVDDVGPTSLSLSWPPPAGTHWRPPSYRVAWRPAAERRRRRRRAAGDRLVTRSPSATLRGLEPGTEYEVAVAPHAEGVEEGSGSREIVVSTRKEAMLAAIADSTCTLTILKISCCITVILGCFLTVFVFIVTRVLYTDCLAQIFAELGTLGAYLCILVSTVQSYSVDDACTRASPELCVAVSVLIQFFFQVVFLSMLLESLIVCSVLKDFLPSFCSLLSPVALLLLGFGIPGATMIVLAAVAPDGFSDGNDNCWLDIAGQAMLPSVLPVIIYGVLNLFLLLSMFDADDPKEGLPPEEFVRARVYLKTRWGGFALLGLTTLGYGTGMAAANDRDSTLGCLFVGFSTVLGLLMPVIRIRCDDQVRDRLKRGLFSNLREDRGAIRVTPAPDPREPPLLEMSEFSARRYKQFAAYSVRKANSYADTETSWHQ